MPAPDSNPNTVYSREPLWDPKRWLPTTRDEVEARGWDYIDVIIISGDAYVDHPAFGTAVIGRRHRWRDNAGCVCSHAT